jgi:diguanylate cyclase (GGDEF)-like protein
MHERVDVPAATLEALMDAAAAVLAADSLDETFGRMTGRLRELVPYDDLVVYEVDPTRTTVRPVFADGGWVDEVMAESFSIEEGITGRTLREGKTSNVAQTVLDPDASQVAGTTEEPEALICVPLIVEGETIAALNVYRTGKDVAFSAHEAEVIERFAAMAALAFSSARQRELLRTQARTDPLTGLLNRRAYYERLAEELARSARTEAPLAVILLDIDRFKPVNDTYGHAEGDRVLRAIGEQLQATVRLDETVARFGGEEFALIVAGAQPQQAFEAAERARSAIASVEVHGSPLSASAGIAAWPAHGSTADELLEAADQALYKAKREGRDRSCEAESSGRAP